MGTPTVTVPLSEFQEITGTTSADRATLIAVDLRDDADTAAVREELRTQYPEYEIRTNREQLQAIAQEKAFIFVSAAVLVVVAVVTGLALTAAHLALAVHHQKQVLAALQAIGISRTTLVALVGTQGVVLGLAGGTLGLAATPAAVWLLNRVTERLVGFESLLRTPEWVYGLGIVIALVIGSISAMVAAWQIARMPSLAQLER
jgi:putative ABC transport system permease protein